MMNHWKLEGLLSLFLVETQRQNIANMPYTHTRLHTQAPKFPTCFEPENWGRLKAVSRHYSITCMMIDDILTLWLKSHWVCGSRCPITQTKHKRNNRHCWNLKTRRYAAVTPQEQKQSIAGPASTFTMPLYNDHIDGKFQKECKYLTHSNKRGERSKTRRQFFNGCPQYSCCQLSLAISYLTILTVWKFTYKRL